MIETEILQRVLATALQGGADFAEVFVEDVTRTGVSLDDGRVESLSSSRDQGAGIRVISGETTGFAHTADLSERSLLEAAQAAADVARKPEAGPVVVEIRAQASTPGPVAIKPSSVAKEEKVRLVRMADQFAREVSESITQVSARVGDSYRKILVANSQGLLASDEQTHTNFAVTCVAQADTGLQTGYESAGLSVGYELFESFNVEQMAKDAANRALTKLEASPAPSGTHVVVIGPGSGGVLFHEACGHGLEADLVKKGASAFTGRVGEMVASPLVTLVDDGTMAKEWGRFAIDDEGHPAKRNVLIEEGVLKDYMWDGNRAREQGRESSGNGRRQSYRHLPMVRMSNTYLAPGKSSPEEIIAGVEKGVYVAKLGGGQVNTATGNFVFGMTEAYLIENGKITSPLREGQLIGNGPKVLLNIDAVGNDFAMGPPGTCGKDGQGVPVGDGVPTLRIKELTIGGTAS